MIDPILAKVRLQEFTKGAVMYQEPKLIILPEAKFGGRKGGLIFMRLVGLLFFMFFMVAIFLAQVSIPFLFFLLPLASLAIFFYTLIKTTINFKDKTIIYDLLGQKIWTRSYNSIRNIHLDNVYAAGIHAASHFFLRTDKGKILITTKVKRKQVKEMEGILSWIISKYPS